MLAPTVIACVILAPSGAHAAVDPALSGFVADSSTLSGATSVAVAGHYAYVTDYYSGTLSAVDISNPAAPVLAGSSAPDNAVRNATTVNIAGGYAFVTSKNRNGPSGSGSNDDGTGNSLSIFDITTTPAVPSLVGTVHDAKRLFGAYGIAVSGHYAYVAAQGCLSGQPCPDTSVGNAFDVIDISFPASPAIVATIHDTTQLAHATSVAISGNYAYVTAPYQDRLTVVDISNPLKPAIVASLRDSTNLNFPVDVAVSGQYAFVVDQISTGRLTVVNVSDPTNPQVVTSLASSSLNGAYRVRVRGSFAFVSASSSADVAAVDISNPASPRLAGTVSSTAGLNRTTGLDLDPTASYVVASSPYLSSQTQPLYPPYALQAGGPTLTGTVNAITLDPSPIAVTITPASEPPNPTAQTAANLAFTVNDAVSTVQCQLDGGPWQACTSPTTQSYSGLAAGSHTFEVNAATPAGAASTASYTWTITPIISTTTSNPTSSFKLLSRHVNVRTGRITITAQFSGPGRATVRGAVVRGGTAIVPPAKGGRCKKPAGRVRGRCRVKVPTVYGRAATAVPGPGTYKIVVAPGARVLEVLRAHQQLHVVLATTFQSQAGGGAVTLTQKALVALRKPKAATPSKKH